MTTTQTANEQFNSFKRFEVPYPGDEQAEPDNTEPDNEPPQDEPKKTAKPLSFSNGDDLGNNAKAPDFLINDILETDTHGLIYGSSQAFKTFAALLIAWCVCTGNSFMGYEVFKPGKVIYICGEGKGALSRRIRAIILALGGFNNNLLILNESIAIDNHTDMQTLKTAIEGYRQLINEYEPVLVICDTFSSLASNTKENDNPEVAQLLKLIKETCSNGVTSSILVLHNGKDKAAGERGASAFRNNVDFSYELSRQPKTMITTMSCIKNKDGELFADVSMKAEIIPLNIIRQDGKEATSLVLMPCNESEKPTRNNKPLDGNNKAILEQLPKALEKHGIDTPGHIKELFTDDVKKIPDKVVSFESWRELANPYITTQTDSDSAKKSAFHRAKNWLESAYYIGFSGNYAWIIKKS